MIQHVFFSWQSDIENRVGRSLIEDALERAIKALKADATIDPVDRSLAVDRDRKNVPGTPPLVETIFNKVDQATAFVSDLTFVTERAGGVRTPNPNVLIEHGWALKSVTWRGMISVMNTAFGHPDEHPLPFDLRHLAWPILFDCPEGADAEVKAAARDDLAAQLKIALRAILNDEVLKAARRPPPPAAEHPHDIALLREFRALISPGLRRFLSLHGFGTPFLRATLDPLTTLSEDWIGATYEFQDPVLQVSLSTLRATAWEFMKLINERIFAMDRNIKMGWAKTDLDVERGYQPETLAGIGAMDAAASQLGEAIDAFERLARDRVPTASTVDAPKDAVSVEAPAEDTRDRDAGAALADLAADRVRGGLPEIVSLPRMCLRLAPLAAMDGFRLSLKAVAEAQLRFPPSTTVRVATDADSRQWWSYGLPRTADRPNPETAWRMRLVRPGLLEYEATVGARIDDDADIGIDGCQLEALVIRNLDRMAAILTGLGLDGPALASITLDGTEDVTLTRPRGGGRRIRQPQVSLSAIRIADLGQPLGGELQETLDMIWLSSGWKDGSPSYQGGTWAGYGDAAPYRLD